MELLTDRRDGNHFYSHSTAEMYRLGNIYFLN